MKYVAITFDDGRSDNYLQAKAIMDQYRMRGTVYVTTGFVDGTWEGRAVLGSPTRPLSAEEVVALHAAGWEIGLHGDKHRTDVEDMRAAMQKLEAWGVRYAQWGISVPNSDVGEKGIEELYESDYGDRIAYIRRGRGCDTTRLKNRVLYALYTLFRWRWAYRRFNLENRTDVRRLEKPNLRSVVIKSHDSARMIADMIERAPDGSVVILMLHSILPPKHPRCGKDPWSWSSAKLEHLCRSLGAMAERGEVTVAPLIELVKE